MSDSRLSSVLFGRSRRPVATPTAMSLLLAGALLVGALLIPDRPDQRAAAAAELANFRLRPANGLRPVSLRDRLIVGLQARLKSEIGFVDRVVVEVHAGRLPERVVDQTFFWAREHSGITRGDMTNRPIIYFQPAMRARAQRIGLHM